MTVMITSYSITIPFEYYNNNNVIGLVLDQETGLHNQTWKRSSILCRLNDPFQIFPAH